MTTQRERDRRAQPMPTAAEAVAAYRAGQQSRPGAGNPFAGRRVLGSAWARGNREAARVALRDWRRRAAARRAD
ncbi:hypothetical protein SEA_KWEKEL_16 [Gordonia phage Kwekel]|uniref:Uncharacterized protein n=2 Tax=Dexdertvirus TaxID=2948679 RepID=A0A7T1KS18_9CAUD|nr:hypothetical protein J1597_gp17 [Gordonia phage Dexdert]QPO17014.1 hypothetical protein SEA_DEXDERT_17 [Gordonia phage Dexdert]WNO27318.1 hypothetical protein SEA_KWEKEL_16 [Gordonia phage Kwekel]